MNTEAMREVRESEAAVVVSTALGRVRGTVCAGVQKFLGIRYGQAPVGDRRFRPPVPVAPWTGVLDATSFGPVSFQPYDASVGHSPQEMSEDCLSLNIWAPTHPGPYPVLVWIHGGGQTVGSTRRAEYEGSHFARNGVVCVTVGYRLGALGFLELGEILGPSYRGSGNNALRDVLLALRWVNEHIAEFGGDPTRVTVGGESAGAKNATTLAGVPEANALFHRLVICSGGAQTVQPLSDAQAVARLVLKEAGLEPDQGAQLLKLSAPALLTAQESAAQRWPRRFAFRPVVDGDFFPAPLLDQLASGTCLLRPMLIGTSREECAISSAVLRAASPPEKQELAHMTPEQFTAVERRYAEVLPGLSASERRIRALTAEEYWIPSLRLAERMAQRGAAVWMYRFDGIPSKTADIPASHVADLPLWWGQQPARVEGAISSDAGTASWMHTTLTAFIGDEDLTHRREAAAWPCYEHVRRAVQTLGRTVCTELDSLATERALWEGAL